MGEILKASTVKISLNRGDSASFPLSLTKADGSRFLPDKAKGEKVTFTVRQGPKSEEYPVIIQKDITGTRIEIEPEDTRDMDYGSYIFDIEAVWLGEELETETVIIGQLNVLAEVT